MLDTSLKIAFRNLVRFKKFALINITGLAVGLACAILILIWIQNELSYDRFFKNADNTVLILRGDAQELTALSSKMLKPAIVQDLPQVINATQIGDFSAMESIILEYGDKQFEESWTLVDDQFLNIFSFPLVAGNRETALTAPNSIMITEKIAHKYFGDKNPLNETLSLHIFGSKLALQVTAVMKDIPQNSHITSEVYFPTTLMESIGIDWNHWGDQSLQTYALIEKCDLNELAQAILGVEKNHNKYYDDREQLYYSILPLTKIHLHGANISYLNSTGDIKYIYIFATVALVILLIASINYTNLSTALSLKRNKEIGIKKVIGADRKTVIKQFYGETLIITGIALLVALLLVRLALPLFNQLTGKSLHPQYGSLPFLLSLSGFVAIVSLLSGLYPAIFMSAFQPIRLFKNMNLPGNKEQTLKKVLIMAQFALSVILIIISIVVFQQLRFFQNSDLGYNKNNLICVKLNAEANQNFQSLKTNLLSNPNVLSVTRSEPLSDQLMTRTSSINWPGKKDETHFWVFNIDYDLGKTLGIKVEQGRFFSKSFSTDMGNAYVINQSAAQKMGITSLSGQELELWGKKCPIIGIVKDFHFSSLQNKIEPLIMKFPSLEQTSSRYRIMSVRCQPGNIGSVLTTIQKTWQTRFPRAPFNYYFLDDNLALMYRPEQQMGSLFVYFTILAIFIACLGLYGLVLFSIEQKTKEIGIRKVLGASIPGIVTLLSKELLVLVCIANIIAWPLAFFVTQKWLQNFAYRIQVHWWVFILAGALTLSIALFAVLGQLLRGARIDPINAIKYE